VSAPRALVTGIGGQDGFYLARLLLERGYEVAGVSRAPAIDPSLAAVRLRDADLADPAAWRELLAGWRPREVYHLASVSFVPAWWERPVETTRFATGAVAALLDAARRAAEPPRVFLAASAEVFGDPVETPQRETTAFRPLTPYGAAKAHTVMLGAAFRRRYGLHVSSGILFNHESPRRPAAFVTRKVTRAAAAISLGLERELVLGSLEHQRDWGFAGDTVRAMWLMLQAEQPGEYVIATGRAHSVRDLVERAFARVGLDWTDHVRVDDALRRGVTDAVLLVGDASKARHELGWVPEVGFERLIDEMVDADLAELGGTSRSGRAPGADAAIT
jgi:GDPmannose 4,6-dehydratase